MYYQSPLSFFLSFFPSFLFLQPRHAHRIKDGSKILPYRFFEVVGNYGEATFDISVSNRLTSVQSFPLEPVHLRLYQNDIPLKSNKKGPNGEEVFVFQAGTELRGLEVRMISSEGQLADDFKGRLFLMLAKNEKNVKKYKFKDGKSRISVINAAKKAHMSYALDFHVPELDLGETNQPQLSVILRTVPGIS